MVRTHPSINKKLSQTVKVKLGGGGIRTHGTRERTTVFKTAPINRSGTPPFDCWM